MALSFAELDAEIGSVLPARETMFFVGNILHHSQIGNSAQAAAQANAPTDNIGAITASGSMSSVGVGGEAMNSVTQTMTQGSVTQSLS